MTHIPYSLQREIDAAKLAKAPTSAQYRSEQPVKLVAAIVLNVVAVVMLAGVL